MFNDRDLAVIAAGAVIAVFSLLLPIPFAFKISLGFVVLLLSIVVALLRMGRDHLTIEEWARRRIRYALRPRKWTFREKHFDTRINAHPSRAAGPDPSAPFASPQSGPHDRIPVLFDFEAVSGEALAGVLLALVGVYFLYALWSGDAVNLAGIFEGLAP